MDPKTEKLVRRTAVVATVTTAYFIIRADLGPRPDVLDPIKNAILSAERSVKEFIFGQKKETPQSESSKFPSDTAEKHP